MAARRPPPSRQASVGWGPTTPAAPLRTVTWQVTNRPGRNHGTARDGPAVAVRLGGPGPAVHAPGPGGAGLPRPNPARGAGPAAGRGPGPPGPHSAGRRPGRRGRRGGGRRHGRLLDRPPLGSPPAYLRPGAAGRSGPPPQGGGPAAAGR